MKNIGGFSMIELMVAILILAIGLIGLAGLQAAGLRTNQSAYYRSTATQLAYDMADRMRANPVGLQNNDYNNGNAGNTDCLNSACTADDLAGYDLKRWKDDLAAKLPGGKGIVCLVDNTKVAVVGDSTNPTDGCLGNGASSVYAIRIWWDDDRSGNTKQGFVLSFQP